MAESWWWVSTEKMTGVVHVESGIVKTAPPIMRKFVGQRFVQLLVWLGKQPKRAASDLAREEMNGQVARSPHSQGGCATFP